MKKQAYGGSVDRTVYGPCSHCRGIASTRPNERVAAAAADVSRRRSRRRMRGRGGGGAAAGAKTNRATASSDVRKN